MFNDRLTRAATIAGLAFSLAAASQAAEIRVEHVDIARVGELRIIEGRISGDEIVDYKLSAERSQILSVDLMTANAAANFNILPAGSNEAIFVGSTEGAVADARLSESGQYLIRVYLMRSAARRNESTRFSLGISLGAPEFADGLAGGPDYWQVAGLGGSSLNLRAGPSIRYPPVSVLRNGNVLQNQGCRMTGSERWCAIRAAHTGLRGWVAGRYLTEAAAPRRPSMPEGGPKGNGGPFDATGAVPCATGAGQPLRQCLFGVVRDGPGNAGVWIAMGEGAERHILFERNLPVATNAGATLHVEKNGDLFVVHVGPERYEIPEAVVNGG